MMSEEQAIFLAEEQAQADFPAYQSGPVLTASLEEECWYIRLRLYHSRERTPLDVLYGVYLFNRSWSATLFDACPYTTMSEDEQALQSATLHLIHDFPTISILAVSFSAQDAERWNILVSFYRLLDRSTAEAFYEVYRDEEGFHTRRIAINEVERGYVKRPSATRKHTHRCSQYDYRKYTRSFP